MIYQTGTIATTAGQTKIKGTGTRWKDNLVGISEGCPISYLINNVVYMNTVLSVNSDTEINLTYPVPVAASAAKYQIATFVLDSMSDGVRKMLANQQYIQYFLRNMDTWMTQDGIVEIKTPTGETVKLESIIALKKLIDGKLSLNGGEVTGPLAVSSKSDYTSFDLKRSGSGRVRLQTNNQNSNNMMSIVNINEAGENISVVSLPNKAGTLMQVGDYGWGTSYSIYTPTDKISDYRVNSITYALGTKGDSFLGVNNHLLNIFGFPSSAYGYQLNFSGGSPRVGFRTIINNVASEWKEFYTTANTTKDANGNLKATSPVIKVFSDHAETNDESEGVEVEKLDIGRYKLKGTLGMNSDASWGGIHGGLVVPNGINNLPLVWADFDVLPDGDIIIETRYRKHTLHPRLEAQRLMTYPEFLKEELREVDTEEGKKEKLLKVEREDYDYCDIPNGHWIDVRVNMPSDSIYNQKLLEAERLAKIEAERLAEEEAKRAAEEAERAEQEATERKQYDLGDNDTLL